jgi:hypothetical protein
MISSFTTTDPGGRRNCSVDRATRLQSRVVRLSADQIAGLAPDAKALAAGRQSAAPRLWQGLGRSDAALWGECKGSAVYQVRVALDDLAAKCSCPSRKFPCKHALGLLFLTADAPEQIPAAEPPAWVTEWLDKRSESTDRKKQRAEKAAEAAPPDPEQQARRAEKRLARVLAGVEALELWLGDLVRTGVASVPLGDAAWTTQAARLVDAQAPGLASRVRRLGFLPRSGADWGDRLGDGLGRLALLLQALRRLDALDGPLAADVRAAVGWTLERDEVIAAGERVADAWAIVGQVVEDDDRFRVQRSWLRGAQSGRDALVLQFAAGPARFPEALVPGMVLEAELAFWPSAHPLRALVYERRGEMKPLASAVASVRIDGMLDRYAQALGRQPWIERFPALLGGVVPAPVGDQTAERFQVIDADGRALPLAGSGHWKLFALSGGHPIDLFGEWDGRSLLPLGTLAEGSYHTLASEEPDA